MTNLQYTIKFDKFESEKLCNLLECSSDELDNIVSSAKQIFEESHIPSEHYVWKYLKK